MSKGGSSFAARLVAVAGGVFASVAALVIQSSALPLSIAMDLAPLLGPEVFMPWAIAFGLVVLGWVPAFVPRAGWLIGLLMFGLAGLALAFVDFGGYVIGSLFAVFAGILFFGAARKARRARKAAKAALKGVAIDPLSHAR